MNIKGYWIGALVFSLAGNVGAAIHVEKTEVEAKVLEAKVLVYEKDITQCEINLKESQESAANHYESYRHCDDMLYICRNNQRKLEQENQE